MSTIEFEVSDDPLRIDLDLVHRFLSATYWAQGRTRETVERSIRNSICVGAYRDDRQIGFGRVISDRAVFGYLADVFVVSEFRGHGVGNAIVRACLDHPELQGVTLFLLRTRDAHELYRPLGFSELPRPEEMMALYRV